MSRLLCLSETEAVTSSCWDKPPAERAPPAGPERSDTRDLTRGLTVCRCAGLQQPVQVRAAR